MLIEETTLPLADVGIPVVVIGPSEGWLDLKLSQLWTYRELLYFLAWRDVKVRYRQTALGAAWAVLQPLLTMIIFTLIFGRLAKIPSDGIPYPLFSFTALVPWTFFSNGLTQSSNSLVSNSNLISKVYFPRLTIPLASMIAGLADFFTSFVVLIAMMMWYKVTPSLHLLYLPLFLLLAFVCALGVGLWLSALNVKYRDVRHTLPFLAQIWMYGTPIAYPLSVIHGPWRSLIALNPMTGVIEGFRWCLLGGNTTMGQLTGVSVAAAVAVLVSGAFYFRRMERTFADII